VTADLATSLEAGALIGRYRIVERIGGGGMGVVFGAEDTLLGRSVAIKLSLTDGKEARELMLREARIAAGVAHPNLVGVFDVGTHEDAVFMAMEPVSRPPLSPNIPNPPPPWTVAAAVGVGASAGLAALHAARLVHRDIKPSNLMLTDRGEVKVIDFGVVEAEGRELSAVAGSAGYIAPELVLGERLSCGADVFALGVVLHEIVTGRPLFTGATLLERMVAVTRERPARLPDDLAPRWFADLVSACLAFEPRERPADASAVLAALRAREPYASLAMLADVCASSRGVSRPVVSDATIAVRLRSQLIGRDHLVQRWATRRGRTTWLYAPAGTGKSRVVAELASRVDSLVVRDCDDLAAIAAALGLDSARDPEAVALALRESGPVLIVLEDVVGELAVVEPLIRWVRRALPDAHCMLTSEERPPASAGIDVVELPRLSPDESEALLVDRWTLAPKALARATSPLAAGHPLTLELLASALASTGAPPRDIGARETLQALVDDALDGLPAGARRTTELVALAARRRASVLAMAREPELSGTLLRLEALGFMEAGRDGAEPTLHPAVAMAITSRLARDGRLERTRGELDALLLRAVDELRALEHIDPEAMLRGIASVRLEVLCATRRAIEARAVDALDAALDALLTVLHPDAPPFDAALPVLDAALALLADRGVDGTPRARAYLARSWARLHDLQGTTADVEAALRCRTPDEPLACEILHAHAAVVKRQGRHADAEPIYRELEERARAAGLSNLAGFAYWERILCLYRCGDALSGRTALAAPSAPVGGLLATRATLARVLLAMEIGDWARCVAELRQALDLSRARGHGRHALVALAYLLEVYVRTDQLALAENVARQAMMLGRTTHAPLPMGLVLHGAAMIALMQGDASRAVQLVERGQRYFAGATTNPKVLARGHALLAAALALLGDEGVEAQLSLADGFGAPTRYATLYSLFARSLRGDADAWKDLEVLLARAEPGEDSEVGLARHVLRAARAHATPPRTTVPGFRP